VEIRQHYEQDEKTLTLDISQRCAATPGQSDKEPFHIPLALGFLDSKGGELHLQLDSAEGDSTSELLQLKKQRQKFVFKNVAERPILSPFRGFSAPGKIVSSFSAADLALRMSHDGDAFNRWEAGQTLAVEELLQLYQGSGVAGLDALFVDSWGMALADEHVDMSLLSQLLTLPSEQYLADQLSFFDPDKVRAARDGAKLHLAEVHYDLLQSRYRSCATTAGEFSLSPQAVGCRSLKNFCLQMMMSLDRPSDQELAVDQYHKATNMTDRLAALSAMIDSAAEGRQELLDDFYLQWKNHPLLLDKWFSLQACVHRADTFSTIGELLLHADFTLSNPNRVHALLGTFSQNLGVFHRADGQGYRLLVDQIVHLDQSNPQVAARMAGPLTRWKQLEPGRRELLRKELELLQQSELSRDLFEIVSKSLA